MEPAATATDWDPGNGLAGYHWRNSDCRNSAPRAAVLLQHGFSEHARRYEVHYARIVPRLLNAGIDVYAFDLQGHGASSGPRRHVDAQDALKAHLRARERLQQQNRGEQQHRGDPPPIFLFGHSFGGALTAWSAMENPTHIRGVVLSAPAFATPSLPLRAFAYGMARIAPSAALVRLPPSGMTLNPEIRAQVQADPLMATGPMPAATIAGLIASNRRMRTKLARWQHPTLLVHGDRDVYTNPRDSRVFLDSIASTDRHYESIAGGFHETLNDPGGERIADTIVSWIQSRS